MISIIIVNWNTCELLKNCIDSIYNLDIKEKYEIIVVDNDSNDGSIEMVKSNFEKVYLINNKKNYGFAKANNIGYQHARGEYLLLLNSDTLLLNNPFENFLKAINEEDDIGIVGTQLLNRDMTYQSSYHSFLTIRNQIKKIAFLNKITDRIKNKSKRKYQSVDSVSGAALFMKKNLYRKLKGLDENFFMYYEETDLCYRASKLGYKISFVKEPSIIHLFGGSSDGITKIQVERNLKSIKYYTLKHNNLVYLNFLMGILVISAVTNLFILLSLFIPISLFKPEFKTKMKKNIKWNILNIKSIIKDTKRRVT